jgi:hypothetical protein
MNNVKIEVIIRVVQDQRYGDSATVAEAHVASKGSYEANELLDVTAKRIAEATRLLESRLEPAVRELTAAAVREAAQRVERTSDAS